MELPSLPIQLGWCEEGRPLGRQSETAVPGRSCLGYCETAIMSHLYCCSKGRATRHWTTVDSHCWIWSGAVWSNPSHAGVFKSDMN